MAGEGTTAVAIMVRGGGRELGEGGGGGEREEEEEEKRKNETTRIDRGGRGLGEGQRKKFTTNSVRWKGRRMS
eukprot:723081-Hanusia_phi.AAC.2